MRFAARPMLRVRATSTWHILAEHAIVTTYLGPERAPRAMTYPKLRVSPHVDVTDDELSALADALAAVST